MIILTSAHLLLMHFLVRNHHSSLAGIDGTQYHHTKKRVEEKLSAAGARLTVNLRAANASPTATAAASSARVLDNSSVPLAKTQLEKGVTNAMAVNATTGGRSTQTADLQREGDVLGAETREIAKGVKSGSPETMQASNAAREKIGGKVQKSRDAPTKRTKRKVVKKTVKRSEMRTGGTGMNKVSHTMNM